LYISAFVFSLAGAYALQSGGNSLPFGTQNNKTKHSERDE